MLHSRKSISGHDHSRFVLKLLLPILFLVLLLPAAGSSSLARQGGVLSFDGRDDFATFENPGRFALRSFTLETWLNPQGAGRPASARAAELSVVPLISRGASSGKAADSGRNFLVGIDASARVLVAIVQDGASGTLHALSGRTRLDDHIWAHAATTYDGRHLRLYLNGALEAEADINRPIAIGSRSPLVLGTSLTPGGGRAGFFRGLLDEVRIWDRARTGAEIRASMKQELPAGPGLVARWGFDDDTGTLLNDSTGRSPSRIVFGAVRVNGTPFETATRLQVDACVPTPSASRPILAAGSAMRYRANTGSDGVVLVGPGDDMQYLANSSDPGLGASWADAAYDDQSWTPGTYGVGYETAAGGAQDLIATQVPSGSFSVYTRARFNIPSAAQVSRLTLGADYDDGFVAWINGVEVYRSPQMPAGDPDWNTNASLHESSNGTEPNFSPIQDISPAGLGALVDGENVLAIGVWNSGAPTSTDLVLVPRLAAQSLDWTSEGLDDSGWTAGVYGVGYESSPPGATGLLQTLVPARSFSVFTRARFDVGTASTVSEVTIGADYDDGFVAWINGTEVYRSPEMPAGDPAFDTNAALHESSNGTEPDYGTPIDISSVALPLLHDGENVLAVGVWNSNAAISTDLVLVPQLSIRSTLDLCDGLDNDCDGSFDEDHVITPTTCGVGVCSGNTGQIICLNGTPANTCQPFAGAAAETILVDFDSIMSYQANTTPAGMIWTDPAFDDASWSIGTYGVGYETSVPPTPNASNLLQTTVLPGTASVFTRARFEIADASAVSRLTLGADYDDGYVAFINGVEVFGSPEMPPGPLTGTTPASLHESSNGLIPNFTPLRDISTRGIPALHDGTNILAIGVWNSDPANTSTDLVLVPRLATGRSETCDGLDNDCDGATDEGFLNSDGDGAADCIDDDDDNDGIADALDCEPLDPLMAAAPPVEVSGVVWAGTPRGRVLTWTDQGSGIVYDIAGGLASDLTIDGGVVNATCVASGQPTSSYDDTRPNPPAGDAYYYVLRASKAGCGSGSYGLATSGIERVPAAACP